MMADRRDRANLSRSHALVKRVRELSRSAAEREHAALLVVEGIRVAEEALSEGVAIREAIVSPRLQREARGRRLLATLTRAGVAPRWTTDRLLAALHDAESHQGVLLLVSRPRRDLEATPSSACLILVACGVQDPGNLGTLVRLADASGASGLVAWRGADPFGPKAVRASAGSIFRTPVERSRQPAGVLARSLRRRGLRLAAAVARGGTDYRDAVFSSPTALFVGSEGAGLPREVEEELEERLSIPMSPRVESINVAAAAAVLLFEASAQMGLIHRPGARQRGRGPGRARKSPPARGALQPSGE